MYNNIFSAQSVQDLLAVLPSLPQAIWETFYVTVVSTALSLVLGLPLGVLLVAGEKGGVLPLPRWLMQVINVIINLLRSIPFLILMIMVFPLSRLLIGTAVGTTAQAAAADDAAHGGVAQNGGEGDGNVLNEGGHALGDHHLADDLHGRRAHALRRFDYIGVYLPKACFDKTRHKRESGNYKRHDRRRSADCRSDNKTGKRKSHYHKEQKRHRAQQVYYHIKRVEHP